VQRAGIEESADTHHDHIHRGWDKSGNGAQLILYSVSRGLGSAYVAQHSVKLPGRQILRPVGGYFPSDLGFGVYGHGVCVSTFLRKGTRMGRDSECVWEGMIVVFVFGFNVSEAFMVRLGPPPACIYLIQTLITKPCPV
jgi:hypothetical protein